MEMRRWTSFFGSNLGADWSPATSCPENGLIKIMRSYQTELGPEKWSLLQGTRRGRQVEIAEEMLNCLSTRSYRWLSVRKSVPRRCLLWLWRLPALFCELILDFGATIVVTKCRLTARRQLLRLVIPAQVWAVSCNHRAAKFAWLLATT